MATISNTPRPGYVWDSTDNVWYPIGVGAHQHTNAADTPAVIPNSIVDAKGDLLTATADNTPARLAVGSNGDTIVADSSTATGLRWQGNFAAGKNKFLNADFSIWQRGTSFSNVNGTYTADRWTMDLGGGIPTSTTSQQTFTPGTAPVAGYEGQYFFRYAQTALNGASAIEINTKIEDVRTLAGQTATISFWAKSSTSNTISVAIRQVFGSGGSGSVDTAATASLTLTTSWQRYSYTVNIPSIAGKTIGTGSYLRPFFSMPITATVNFDLWGVQLEAGSTATAFQTATGNPASELAACQRYYWQTAWNTNGATTIMVSGIGTSSTAVAQAYCAHPVTMRAIPSAALNGTSNMFFYNGAGGGSTFAISAITAQNSSTIAGTLNFTTSGTTANVIYNLLASTAGNGYISFSAEL